MVWLKSTIKREKMTNIIREEGVTYIATISGGKDSVTMCDLLLKNGYPVDYILFQDTMLEFSAMYQYINKVEEYFLSRYNKKIIRLKPRTTFEEWCFGVIRDKNAKLNGWIRGIPMVWAEPCYWRRESKQKPSDEFLKKNKIENAHTYIGFTKGENRSLSNTEKQTFSYPLKDIFHMTELNCQEYLMKQDMENPLYRHFERTGCGVCTAQSEKAWFNVWKYFPETWAYMKTIEERLEFYERDGYKIKNKYWFNSHRTCSNMEEKFIEADKQGCLFDFSDEPLRDCFCKI